VHNVIDLSLTYFANYFGTSNVVANMYQCLKQNTSPLGVQNWTPSRLV